MSRSRACCIYAKGDRGGKARRDLARPGHEVSCSPLLWGSPLGITGRFGSWTARCRLSGAIVTCDRLSRGVRCEGTIPAYLIRPQFGKG